MTVHTPEANVTKDDPDTVISAPLAVAEIEAGATGDTLRLWQAREAIRQAELRLASQAASLQAFEARSTAALGWVAAGITAIGGAALATLSIGHQFQALAISVAAIPLAISAFYALKVLWPKSWNVVGFDPDWLMNPRYESELEQTEAMALTYAESIKANGAFLNIAGAAMRRAWWWLLAAPTIALLSLFVTAVLAWAAGRVSPLAAVAGVWAEAGAMFLPLMHQLL
jgi:uncharacterized membrane protein YhaH (DUF805 family)